MPQGITLARDCQTTSNYIFHKLYYRTIRLALLIRSFFMINDQHVIYMSDPIINISKLKENHWISGLDIVPTALVDKLDAAFLEKGRIFKITTANVIDLLNFWAKESGVVIADFQYYRAISQLMELGYFKLEKISKLIVPTQKYIDRFEIR